MINEDRLLVLSRLLGWRVSERSHTPASTTETGEANNFRFSFIIFYLTGKQSVALNKGFASNVLCCSVKIGVLFHLLCVWILFQNSSIPLSDFVLSVRHLQNLHPSRSFSLPPSPRPHPPSPPPSTSFNLLCVSVHRELGEFGADLGQR